MTKVPPLPPPPGCQFTALYRALANSRFLCRLFFFLFFCSPLFLPPSGSSLPPPIIFFDRRLSLSGTVLCTFIIFCPSTVGKLDKICHFFQQIFKMPPPRVLLPPPPLAGSAGPVVMPLHTYLAAIMRNHIIMWSLCISS